MPVCFGMACGETLLSNPGPPKRSRPQTKLQAPRRVLEDAPSSGGYFRVHVHPKRFPAAHGLSGAEWASRVVHDGAQFVVVNKPPGLQVPPTVDNVRESLLAKVEEASVLVCVFLCVCVCVCACVCVCVCVCLQKQGADTILLILVSSPSAVCWSTLRGVIHTKQVLGLELGVLAPPHRLDSGTEGLVVLAKTPEFSR